MRRPKKRTVLIAVTLLLIVGVVSALWTVLDWPPVRLILKYGFPPTGGPTGRTRVIEGIEFIELKPGYFRMGSHYLCEGGDLLGRISETFGLSWGTPPGHARVECPTRWVEIEKPFWIASTELTGEVCARLRPEVSRILSHYGKRFPAMLISPREVGRICRLLANKHRLGFRAPTVAEWEFACRAGSTDRYCYGDDPTDLRAWSHCRKWTFRQMSENPHRRSRKGPAEVATLHPNAWGLHDVHGNMRELCTTSDHTGEWIARGGGWMSNAADCRSAVRRDCAEHIGMDVGFRPVFTLPEEE